MNGDLTRFSIEVERGRLRAFAAATGQDDPVYSDGAAARSAGFPSLPVPPTFLFCLEMEGPKPMEMYERLGIDYPHVLHGEQHFRYHRMAFAGETLRFAPRITDQYQKKGGSLKFVVRETRVEGEDGAAVADLRSVFVVRDPGRPGTPGTKVRRIDSVREGDTLPPFVAGPITRQTLVRYAGASGDYNGLHTDPDHARRAGYADVFAHGMLSAAYLARVVTDWVGQPAMRSLGVRFVAITHLDDEVHCRAVVAKKFVEHGEERVTLELSAQDQRGETKVTGTAVVAPA